MLNLYPKSLFSLSIQVYLALSIFSLNSCPFPILYIPTLNIITFISYFMSFSPLCLSFYFSLSSFVAYTSLIGVHKYSHMQDSPCPVAYTTLFQIIIFLFCFSALVGDKSGRNQVEGYFFCTV